MEKARARFWMAVYAIIGSTVGVGVFSLPYVIAQAGLWLGLLWLVFVAILNLLALLMYAEVVMLTPGHSRLPGLARRYLGGHWAPIVGLLGFMHSWGAMLGYIVIGGVFLSGIFGTWFSIPEMAYQIGFMTVMAIVLFGGLGFVAVVERYMVWLLVTVFAVMVIAGIPHMDLTHWLDVGSPAAWFLPFGPLLFAFSAFPAIPEAMAILREDRHRLRAVIFTSSAFITVFYAAFALLAIAVAGPAISVEAIHGIAQELGAWFLILGSFMGIVAVATSFILLGISITDSLVYDFKMRHIPAWAVTVSVPMVVFGLGARDFLQIVSITGAVIGGAVGLIVLWIYSKARIDICLPKRCLSIPRFIVWFVGLSYLAGVGLELFL